MDKYRISWERGRNFTLLEKDLLLGLLQNYIHIIESKRSNSSSAKQKLQCWQNLALEFNTKSKEGYRSWEKLKICYENWKRRTKHNQSTKVDLSNSCGHVSHASSGHVVMLDDLQQHHQNQTPHESLSSPHIEDPENAMFTTESSTSVHSSEISNISFTVKKEVEDYEDEHEEVEMPPNSPLLSQDAPYNPLTALQDALYNAPIASQLDPSYNPPPSSTPYNLPICAHNAPYNPTLTLPDPHTSGIGSQRSYTPPNSTVPVLPANKSSKAEDYVTTHRNPTSRLLLTDQMRKNEEEHLAKMKILNMEYELKKKILEQELKIKEIEMKIKLQELNNLIQS